MTTKISFYILKESSPKSRALYACRIIEKAYINKHKIYVHTTNLEEARDFDTQLWTFGDISFVPHEISAPDIDPNTPVIIGYSDTIANEQNDVLVNLTSGIPTFYGQFNRVIEVIPDDAELKKSARERYSTYQKYGLQAEIFNV